MNRTLRLTFAATALLALAACESEKVDVLKSPCVGLDSSPCGPKRTPVNNWVDAGTVQQA